MIKINDKRLKQPNLKSSEDLFYLLGAIKSDGWISQYGYANRADLEVNDFDFSLAFFNSAKEVGLTPRTYKIRKKLSNQDYVFRTEVNSKLFVDWIKKYDINKIKVLQKKFQIAFIRGIFDGEGCYKKYPKNVHKKRHTAQITMKDRKTIFIISDIIKKIGFENKVYKCDNSKGWSGTLYQLWISGKSSNVIDFLNTINSNIKRKRYVEVN